MTKRTRLRVKKIDVYPFVGYPPQEVVPASGYTLFDEFDWPVFPEINVLSAGMYFYDKALPQTPDEAWALIEDNDSLILIPETTVLYRYKFTLIDGSRSDAIYSETEPIACQHKDFGSVDIKRWEIRDLNGALYGFLGSQVRSYVVEAI